MEKNENILENYYLRIKCSETAFIQLQYEINEQHRIYNNIIPKEINLVSINNYLLS